MLWNHCGIARRLFALICCAGISIAGAQVPPADGDAAAIAPRATQRRAAPVALEVTTEPLDIDASSTTDALTDGLLVVRYLFGLRGNSLIQGAIGPGATRTTAAQIEAYLAGLTQ